MINILVRFVLLFLQFKFLHDLVFTLGSRQRCCQQDMGNECHLDNTFYSYQVSGVQLLFNCVYKIVAVKFEGQDYRSVSTLDTSQKVNTFR